MKNAVYSFVGILAITGLMTLTVLGGSLLQNEDPRGYPVLALVVGGLLLTFITIVMSARKSSQQNKTASLTSSAEYPHSPEVVWAAIRPAEAAHQFSDNLAHAFSVPAIPDGPGERQCFFYRDGRMDLLEVIKEVPEELAVTRSSDPLLGSVTITTYRLDPTRGGCRLTFEMLLETPAHVSVNLAAMQAYGDLFVGQVGALLDRQVKEKSDIEAL